MMSSDLAFDLVELVPATTTPRTQALREIGFRANSWLPGEEAQLRELFNADVPVADIAVAVGRPLHGVRARIDLLGLRRNSQRPWTPEEENELAARYGEESAAAIALSLGRGVPAVYARAALLKLSDAAAAPYDEWEDAQIRAGYAGSVPVRQIAALIGRTMIGVCCRAAALGVRHPHQPPNWSDGEMRRALELAEEGHRYTAIIEQLVQEGWPRRSKNGFGQRIRILGYGRGWGRHWLEEEDELLRQAYAAGASLVALAARLGRETGSLRWRAGEIGLQGTHVRKAGWRGAEWTEADEALLRAEFGKTPSPELACKLGRTKAAMFSRANFLGLRHGYINKFTPEERRAIGIVWRLGLPLAVPACAMNRDPAVISKQAIRLGIPFDSPDRPVQPTRGRKAARQQLSLAEILDLLPPDPEFDARLEAAAQEIDERASRNRAAGASARGRRYRQQQGLPT